MSENEKENEENEEKPKIKEESPKDLIESNGKQEENAMVLKAVTKLLEHKNDSKGYTKTDIPSSMVNPLSQLITFSKNPTPLWNRYLEQHGLSEKKLDIKMIYDEYIDVLLKSLVSKDRAGRGEAVEIIKHLVEPQREEKEMSNLEKELKNLTS